MEDPKTDNGQRTMDNGQWTMTLESGLLASVRPEGQTFEVGAKRGLTADSEKVATGDFKLPTSSKYEPALLAWV